MTKIRAVLEHPVGHPLRWAVASGVLALALDQAVKAVQRLVMTPGESVALVPGVFHLTYRLNDGAAFSMLAGNPRPLALVAVVVTGAIVWLWRAAPPTTWMPAVGAGLLVAGALGNAIDRLAYGVVTDIFDVRIINFAVFNVADSAITVGAVLVGVWLVFFSDYVTEGGSSR